MGDGGLWIRWIKKRFKSEVINWYKYANYSCYTLIMNSIGQGVVKGRMDALKRRGCAVVFFQTFTNMVSEDMEGYGGTGFSIGECMMMLKQIEAAGGGYRLQLVVGQGVSEATT